MLKIGNTDINKAYLGSEEVNKAYLGSDIVFDSRFISVWRTTTPNETITLPTPTNYRVDWGDGTITTDTNAHVYIVAGDYEVKITNLINDFSFINSGDSEKIYSIKNYGLLNLIPQIFYGCTNINIDTSKVPKFQTSLERVFRDCNSLVYNNSINNWDTSNVVNFSFLFAGCSLFNQEVNFNTQSVVNFTNMFESCISFNNSINFQTPNLTSCRNFIRFSTSFNSDFNFSDTSGVVDMSSMFRGCTNFNKSLSFDLSNCENISQFLMDCPNFDSNLNFTNVNSLLTTVQMFQNCSVFNNSIVLDTSLCESFARMFFRCTSFNQPLSFNTSNVESFNAFLYGCTSFNQPLDSFSFVSVQDLRLFMGLKTFNDYNPNYLSDLLIKLDQDLLFSNMISPIIDFGTIKYDSTGVTAYNNLINKGFIITSGGLI